MLGSDGGLVALHTLRYASILDVSKHSFWVWFLVLADYMCTNSAKPESIISSAWEEDYKKLRLSPKYGTVLRDVCLTKLFDMDHTVHNLLDDPSLPLTESASCAKGPTWTARDGYGLIDRYHLAYGEYEYTSFAKAAECMEHGRIARARFLSTDVPTPTMIWTCISDGAPVALKTILSPINDINWLDQVPEHIMYRRRLWHGWSTGTGEDLRKRRELGWTEPWPPALTAITRAMMDHPDAEVFSILADWLASSAHAEDYAQLFWKAGGFLEPSFCRRLIKTGASVEVQCRNDGMTALHVAASVWDHDIVDILVELGADPTTKTSNGLTALQLFLCGPERIIKDTQSSFSVSSRSAFKRLPPREQQRRRKNRILSTLQALCKALPTKSPLDQLSARGEYPLMLAVKTSPTATKGLIRAGANVEQTDQWGRTALMHFFCGGITGRSTKTLKHLLEAGADSSAFDAAGHSTLQYWVREVTSMDLASLYPGSNRFNTSFDALTSTGPLSDNDTLIRTLAPTEFPLAAAARLGNTKLCWALCMAGADPNKHGLTTKTRLPEGSGTQSSHLEDLSWKPLLIALMHNAYTTAAILLSYGADVTFKTPSRQRTKYNKYSVKTCGTTALHVAVKRHPSDHVGFNMSLSTGGFSDCTFLAVGHPEHQTLKENTEMKLAIHARRQWEKSESHKKRFKDESSDSEYELPKTKPYNDNTGDKLLPYDKLSETMLQGVHTKLNDPLYFKIIDQKLTPALRQAAIVELLLKKGAPVNAKTQEGRTPLHVAVDSNLDLVLLLLKYGTDPNVATADGITPLMQAASRGDRELVKILLLAGADPDAQLIVAPLEKRQCASFIARSHWTFRQCDAPLTAMVVAAERGHYGVVELLLQHGADPNKPIEHHAHGRLPSNRDKRRRARHHEEPNSSDSEVEPEEWKGYISIGTALSWARDEVRELLLRNGANPEKEQPLRECDCAVIEKRKERGWLDDSEDDLPAKSDGEDSDSKLRRHRFPSRRVVKWDGDTDDNDW
ncbi:ankyrin [Karstenula rhodostoma CBS 690.94]|uniref:Ankyrin n=1 Tax=Karstenula rhodostoma CBS 690.94 TaxID=1392251 RepID=A0A9P4PF87_9PLEO|nr:ankyrin [Karstenula rhodostoma CBS 690.94]